ncbi:hypothetical protein LguiB_004658 [Lonicera macranthoides]
MLLRHRTPLHKLFFTSSILMKPKYFLKPTPFPLHPSLPPLFYTPRFPLSPIYSKPISTTPPFSLKTSGFSSIPHSTIGTPVSEVGVENPEKKRVESEQMKVLVQKLKEIEIDMASYKPGQYSRLLCPKCKGGDSKEKSFSLFIAEDGNSAFWTCFRAKCGWRGSTRAFADAKSSYEKMNKVPKVKQLRKVTEEDLELEPLCSEEEDTEKIFYGLDDIQGASDIIIVAGEMDKLSMEEAGFRNCVSVPDGSSASVSTKDLPSEAEDTEYQYLWNCKEYLQKASRIILATNGDQPGQALAEELARRVGRERCWRVRWPKKNESDHFKDINEVDILICDVIPLPLSAVLMCKGPSALREVIENAELYPIQGLRDFKNYANEIEGYYHQIFGYELGVSTGWRALDDLYNARELTIVTGVPNSGKSEWIDALLCNLNETVGWKFALCSMENTVREHARKLLEKHIKKPFFNVGYGESVERMSFEDLERGKKWLSDTFYPIRCENDCLPDIDWVLGLAKSAVLRHGVNGLVVDPYNELDHQRRDSQTETEYVSQLLTKVKRFAQHHSCHVWFVAHPRQLQQWDGSPPNMYDISGSAHFINKCDNGVVIHRNRDPKSGPIDQVCVRKVRNKVAGNIGDAFLSYNRVTGEFMDIGQPRR